MAESFYTILTDVGLAAIANAQITQSKVDFATFVVGDGDGQHYNPVSNATSLKNEVWRGPISAISIDENNSNWIIVEAVIPGAAGGFSVREMGVLDTDGRLLAIGKVPETYKPATSEGSLKDLYLRMILEVSNASAVTLKIDPAVVFASKKYVDDEIKKIPKPDMSGFATKDEMDAVEQAVEELQEGSAMIPDLETENKTLAGAINEVKNYAELTKEELQLELQSLQQKLGELNSLDTDAKDDLVSAINEVLAALATHSADNARHVTPTDRTNWNNAVNAIQVGSLTVDPNTTQDAYIVTNHANSPGMGVYWHVRTLFYGGNRTRDRAQYAITYNGEPCFMIRHLYNNVWTPWTEVGGGGLGGRVFTSNGSFTAPKNGVYKVTVIAGGTGGDYGNHSANGGNLIDGVGKSGATAIKYVTLSKGAVIPVTVGTGGAGAKASDVGPSNHASGKPGGTSSFGTHCSATDSIGVGGDINIETMYGYSAARGYSNQEIEKRPGESFWGGIYGRGGRDRANGNSGIVVVEWA